MSKLEPCPFCGGKAKLVVKIDVNKENFVKVYCTKCGAKIKKSIRAEDSAKDYVSYLWNRRIDDERRKEDDDWEFF